MSSVVLILQCNGHGSPRIEVMAGGPNLPSSWSLPGLVSSGSIAKKTSWGDPEENAAICRVEEDMATSLTNPNEQDEK